MRSVHKYFFKMFSEFNINDYTKNIKFRIISWNSDSNKFKAIINGNIRIFQFYGYEDYGEIIKKINAYYSKSKSVNKTIQYIEKRFAKLLPIQEKNKSIKLSGKFVKCPKCDQIMQISGNKPGSICPNCNNGKLELV